MADRQTIRRQQLTQNAEGYLELGMPVQALTALSRIDPATKPDSKLDSKAMYLRGEALRWLERWEEAIPWLRDAAKHDPENIHIWLALGWCYKRTGQIHRAIESLEQGLEADADKAILHYNLACYWSLAKNKKRALSSLERAINMDAHYRDLVHEESDFDPLRSDPDFQAITSVIV